MKKIIYTLRRIWELYKPFRLAIAGALFLALLAQGLGLLTPYFTGRLIDGFHKNLATEALVMIALYILASEICEITVNYLLGILRLRKLDKSVRSHLTKETLRTISKFSIGQITNENSGFRQSVISKGESAVMDIAELLIGDLLPMAAKALVTIVALALISPLICALSLGGMITFLLVSYRLNSQIIGPVKKHRGIQNKLDTHYSEIMRNMRLVMVNAQEECTINNHWNNYQKLSTDVGTLWTSYNVRSLLLREPVSILTLFLTILCCIDFFKTGVFTSGTIVTVTSWTMMLLSTLGRVGPYQRRLTIWISTAHQYFEMLDIVPAVKNVKNPVIPEQIIGKIEFRNVSFAYPALKKLEEDDEHHEEELVGTLHNVSFTLEAGETSAFVGHSGAGKSTIINLLLRAYDPDQGEVQVDGTDLRLLDLSYLRSKIGYVEQQVKLWDQTLRYNILYTRNGDSSLTTDKELESLAQKACIDRFYDRLGKKRFETWIGENGIKLSGGEQQRVGIARALAKDPSILIFDEATNSLDNLNEAIVRKAIKQSLEGKTGIIIAHRLSTIRQADKIIVLSKGKVVGIGKHNYLLETCEYYRNLVDSEREALTHD